MNKLYYTLLVLIFILSGCASTAPKAKKEEPAEKSASPKSDSKTVKAPQKEDYHEKGRKSAKEKKYDEALEYFLKAEETEQDDDELLLDIGTTLRHLGHNEEALKYFQRAFTANQYSYQSLRNIGIINREMKLQPEAIVYFQKAIEIEPNDRVSIVNLADIFFEKKEYEKCYKYISLYYKALYDIQDDEHKEIRSIFKRFDSYITVIQKERRKKEGKVTPSFQQ